MHYIQIIQQYKFGKTLIGNKPFIFFRYFVSQKVDNPFIPFFFLIIGMPFILQQ
ncbi:hypothetical protein pb186bvf_004268 [Paramecium bursaria]